MVFVMIRREEQDEAQEYCAQMLINHYHDVGAFDQQQAKKVYRDEVSRWHVLALSQSTLHQPTRKLMGVMHERVHVSSPEALQSVLDVV